MRYCVFLGVLVLAAVAVHAVQPDDMRFGVKRERTRVTVPEDALRLTIGTVLNDTQDAPVKGNYYVLQVTEGTTPSARKTAKGAVGQLASATIAKEATVVIIDTANQAAAALVGTTAGKAKQVVFIDEQFLTRSAEQRKKLPVLNPAESVHFRSLPKNTFVLARFGMTDDEKKKFPAEDKPVTGSPDKPEDQEILAKENEYAAQKRAQPKQAAAGAAPSAPAAAALPAALLQLSASVKAKAKYWYRNRVNGNWEYWEATHWNNIHFSRCVGCSDRHHTARDDRPYWYYGNTGGYWLDRFNWAARTFASWTSLYDLRDAFNDWYAA